MKIRVLEFKRTGENTLIKNKQQVIRTYSTQCRMMPQMRDKAFIIHSIHKE